MNKEAAGRLEWMESVGAFAEHLYSIGWTSPNDGQNRKLGAVWADLATALADTDVDLAEVERLRAEVERLRIELSPQRMIERVRFINESGGAAGGVWGSDKEFEADLATADRALSEPDEWPRPNGRIMTREEWEACSPAEPYAPTEAAMTLQAWYGNGPCSPALLLRFNGTAEEMAEFTGGMGAALGKLFIVRVKEKQPTPTCDGGPDA